MADPKNDVAQAPADGLADAIRALCRDDGRKQRICDAALDRLIGIASHYDLELAPPQVRERLCARDLYIMGVFSELLQAYSCAELLSESVAADVPHLSLSPIPYNDSRYSSLPAFLADFGRSLPSRLGKVLVKPNIVSKEEFPETTDLCLLKGVIDALVPRSRHVVVGDGPSLFY